MPFALWKVEPRLLPWVACMHMVQELAITDSKLQNEFFYGGRSIESGCLPVENSADFVRRLSLNMQFVVYPIQIIWLS